MTDRLADASRVSKIVVVLCQGAVQEGPGGWKNMAFRIARSAAFKILLPFRSIAGLLVKNADFICARSAAFTIRL